MNHVLYVRKQRSHETIESCRSSRVRKQVLVCSDPIDAVVPDHQIRDEEECRKGDRKPSELIGKMTSSEEADGKNAGPGVVRGKEEGLAKPVDGVEHHAEDRKARYEKHPSGTRSQRADRQHQYDKTGEIRWDRRPASVKGQQFERLG